MGWSIAYIKGSQLIIKKKLYFFVDRFILANRVDPDEMQHIAAFYLGLHCLQKYIFRSQ